MRKLLIALAIVVIPATWCATVRSQAPAYDLIIRGGQVIDGTGNPWFYADVAVKDGRIAAVGSLGAAKATRVIDATGKIVTPGFIDMHSHADGGLASMELRHSPNMVAQGITLSVVNQDGRSPRWPIRDQKALYEKQGIGTNAALLVGHATVRTRVMGNQRDNQVATDADIRAMQQLVEEGMADGAFGLSSGLEYDPGRFSETREVVALTRMVKPYGGFYISHERSEGADPMWKVKSDPSPFVSLIEAVNETITIGRETGVPVVASHLKAKGASYWGSSQVATRLIHEARAQGIPVYADQYPYETSGTDGSTVLIPGWALQPPGQASGDQLNAGRGGGASGKAAFKQRLGLDDDVRKIRMDIAHEIDRRGGASRIIITRLPGREVRAEVTAVRCRRSEDGRRGCGDLAAAERRRPRRRRAHARLLARRKSISITSCSRTSPRPARTGISRGSGRALPHARFYGTMARKIRYYSLDRGVISLPHAIRSMTSLAAQIIGLKDRGLVQTGYWADLVVFDPKTVADKATFTEPHQYPTGIPFVFVNGVAVVDDGKLTQATPGKVLTPKSDGSRYAK